MDNLTVKVKGGNLVATVSTDPDYPGIDVEYVADDDTGEALSRPRVLVEYPEDMGLRALIWNNPESEDYNEKVSLLNGNGDKTFKYFNIVEEIREAIKEGYLKADVNNANNVLLYREAGDENHPEGWYSENILAVASELCHDETILHCWLRDEDVNSFPEVTELINVLNKIEKINEIYVYTENEEIRPVKVLEMGFITDYETIIIADEVLDEYHFEI